MSKSTIVFIIIAIIFCSFATGIMAYSTAYNWGKTQGYNAGYEEVLSRYPQMELNNVSFTLDGNTIYFGNITVTGEQRIIDIINDLPNMGHFISFR